MDPSLNDPWTSEELDDLLPAARPPAAGAGAADAAEIQALLPSARPLPALSVEECFEYCERLMALAMRRPLLVEESFLCGQLLEALAMAAAAELQGGR